MTPLPPSRKTPRTIQKTGLALLLAALSLFSLSCAGLHAHAAPAAQMQEVAHLDFDGDGIANGRDDDIDGDRRSNRFDRDTDGDGVPDESDPEPFDPRGDNNPFGVFCHFFRGDCYSPARIDRACKMLADMGARWIVVVFMWDRIEGTRGIFHFDLSDAVVRSAERYGLKVVPLLAYSARWASSAPEGASQRDLLVHPPRETALFAEYVRRCVERYRDKIKYWQVWGEQNMPDNWKPEPDPAAYLELLKAAANAARAADPSCRIIAGSLGGRMDEYLETLLDLGAARYFDIVGINPYINPAVRRDMFYPEHPEDSPTALVAAKIKKVAAIIRARCPDKELWITEMGCPGMNRPGNWWFLKKTPDEERQAAWLRFMYEQLPGFYGIRKVFWYNFRTTPDEVQAQAGLVHSDFKPKPAYRTYKNLAANRRRQ